MARALPARLLSALVGAARALVVFLRNTALTVAGASRLFVSARAFDHAASISFFALLSVAPFLILVIAAAGYIAVLAGPQSGRVEGMIGEITSLIQGFTPVEDEHVRQVVHSLIAQRGRFGLVGALVMLLGASMVFGALEHAVEDIFHVDRRRRFLVSRAVFSVVLVATGCAVFLLHYGMTLADSFMMAARGVTLDEWLRESPLLDAALTYFPVPIGFLAALYVPGIARARFRNALAGAAVFFVLWEVAREGYGWYVEHVARFGLLYGSLATPILLILWTFYSANILLFALAWVATLETRECPASSGV